MSTNTHWFIIWVPSGHHEKEARSRSRTVSSTREIIQDTETTTAVKSERPFVVTKINEPLTENLPLIQEDEIATSFNESSNQPNVVVNTGENISQIEELKTESQEIPKLKVEDEGEKDLTVCSDSFLEWESLEDIVTKVVTSNKQTDALHILQSVDKKQTQFSFSVPFEEVENLLIELQNNGIGRVDDSSVSVFSASVHYNSADKGPKESDSAEQEAKLDKFYSSIKSRLLVSEVIARIQSGAEFSFDFLLLLILAGMIAFMGLLENSSVVLVASMLVSPLMGPILAGIFGGAIQDKKLSWSGVRHEVYALFICIFIGFFFGLMVCPWAEEYGVSQWPTEEMLSRGELRALWVGILIAIPSGAGVALSVLGGNAGSLVGVAISASLLPPAVNCGIFWALSLVLLMTGSGPDSHAMFHGFGQELDLETNTTKSLYQPRYSNDLSMESFYLGLISLALTIINIICIIITGVLILKLKEVTPAKIPQKFSHFWRKDVRAHRNYNKKIRKGDKHGLFKDMQISVGNGKQGSSRESMEGPLLHSMFERAAADEDLINIRDWVAMPSAAMPRDPYSRTPRTIQEDPWRDSAYELLVSPSSKTETSGDQRTPYRTLQLNNNQLYQRRLAGQNPTENYLTINSTGTFLDVPLFLQKELRRSKEIRKQLYAGLKHSDL